MKQPSLLVVQPAQVKPDFVFLWFLLFVWCRLAAVVSLAGGGTWTSRTTTRRGMTSRAAEWDPVSQIYVGGVVPGASNAPVAALVERDASLAMGPCAGIPGKCPQVPWPTAALPTGLGSKEHRSSRDARISRARLYPRAL
jgi:hypothetical protein